MLRLSQSQAEALQVKSRRRWSPYFESCCLLVSANASYQHAEVDVEVLTGVKISHSTLQRLVQRQDYPDSSVSHPQFKASPASHHSLPGLASAGAFYRLWACGISG